MYAILDISGRQEKVEKGMEFVVDRMDEKVGNTAKFATVLFAKKGNSYIVGNPHIKGASVECEVVSHVRGEKVIAYKYKRRKSYHRKVGHRQDQTVLKVKDINIS